MKKLILPTLVLAVITISSCGPSFCECANRNLDDKQMEDVCDKKFPEPDNPKERKAFFNKMRDCKKK